MLEPTSAGPEGGASPVDSFDWEGLLGYIKERRVVPIVGPDVLLVKSEGRDMLLDQYLARRLAESLGLSVEKLPETPTVAWVAFEYLQGERRPQRIYNQLSSILAKSELAIPEALLQLAQITDFSLFVGTTFDSFLVQALAIARGQEPTSLAYSPNRGLEDLPPAGERRRFLPTVYQLFGKASSIPDYAVTEEDTLEFLHALQSVKQPANLFDVLRDSYLLLLGCRLPDWLARFFVRAMSRDRLLTTVYTREFVVDDTIRRDQNLVLFLKHYSTEVYTSGGVIDFVHELHRRWRKTQPAQAGAGRAATAESAAGIPEGFIFLSYAREDEDAVKELKGALDESGLDVWLDVRDIPPAADWDARIHEGIRRCSIFIPCLSRRAQSDQASYFRREWKAALERSKDFFGSSRRFIWPVAFDDLPLDATEIPVEFGKLQWARFSDPSSRKRLVDELRLEIRSIRR
jgi:hypothetical protein